MIDGIKGPVFILQAKFDLFNCGRSAQIKVLFPESNTELPDMETPNLA